MSEILQGLGSAGLVTQGFGVGSGATADPEQIDLVYRAPAAASLVYSPGE